MLRQTIGALAGDDDRAARPDNLRRGTDALDRLVEVLVERIDTVGSEHQVVRSRNRGHGGRAGEGAARVMALEQVTGENGRNRVVAIEGDVQVESDADRRGDVAHGV